ncbi:hypothetical protein CcCBS67573_g05350 [Chytriomyces confervae]|uniref:Uncharacterized protein n=1 Tax=Chytriomyces confervae TaxID=246404 RepID=A0A507EWM7_9FUNG|nr:hypothetical protein CcCBS67573_g07224 [Chytriomyces confervae]TPX73380.1 hypothetical protein CcCBS67573_g05350 [Chytriomyces confervae]
MTIQAETPPKNGTSTNPGHSLLQDFPSKKLNCKKTQISSALQNMLQLLNLHVSLLIVYGN